MVLPVSACIMLRRKIGIPPIVEVVFCPMFVKAVLLAQFVNNPISTDDMLLKVGIKAISLLARGTMSALMPIKRELPKATQMLSECMSLSK